MGRQTRRPIGQNANFGDAIKNSKAAKILLYDAIPCID